jgi:hypothetical protein
MVRAVAGWVESVEVISGGEVSWGSEDEEDTVFAIVMSVVRV